MSATPTESPSEVSDASARLLESLNAEQRRAANHPDGPLLILAGAGTGKTRTLVARTALLLERGVAPERILLLTFTRRAAQEMLRRVAAETGDRRARRVHGGTFHAVGQRILRDVAARAGLSEAFTIVDRSDSEDLISLCRESLGLRAGARSVGGKRFPSKGALLSIYSRTVSGEADLHTVLQTQFPWCAEFEPEVKQVFAAYEETKQSQDVLDFDDLLAYWEAVCLDPVLGPELGRRYDHILVDEYQDTNPIQRRILRAMRADDLRITAVGDDAQAIYGFRGGTVENIRSFPADFDGATVVRLEQNYRSTAPILEVANAVIGLAEDVPEMFKKRLVGGRPGDQRPLFVRAADEDEQAVWVAEDVLRRREEGIALRRQAVLFRTAHHSDLLEVELGRRQIPFRKFGGLRFSDAAHVKDVIAFLRVVENPGDRSAWFRILRLLDGVGPKTAAKVLDHLDRHGQRLAALSDPAIPAGPRAQVAALGDLLAEVASHDDVGPAIERIHLFYAPILKERYERPEARLEDLTTLAHVATGAADRGAFLAELALHPPDATGDHARDPHLDEDWLVLSTIHSAKGLEWESVSVLHAADGMIPADLATKTPAEVEEERRLFYVALTRAKRHLAVVFPQRYHNKERRRQDWNLYAKVTRFLPPALAELFETVVARDPKLDGVDRQAGPQAVTDLRLRARARWS